MYGSEQKCGRPSVETVHRKALKPVNSPCRVNTPDPQSRCDDVSFNQGRKVSAADTRRAKVAGEVSVECKIRKRSSADTENHQLVAVLVDSTASHGTVATVDTCSATSCGPVEKMCGSWTEKGGRLSSAKESSVDRELSMRCIDTDAVNDGRLNSEPFESKVGRLSSDLSVEQLHRIHSAVFRRR